MTARLLRSLGAWLLAAFAGFAPRLYAQGSAPLHLDSARFTVAFFPGDAKLAASVLAASVASDTFPWLPRPLEHVRIAIAPDGARFRDWAGSGAPEWGAALAFPETNRIVMQGHAANSSAGNPIEVVRHEIAHLALHEFLGPMPPRWFDEGYASVAAHEWQRDDILAANLGLALRGTPTLDQLDENFRGGSVAAQSAYALSYRAVMELAALDPDRGLTLFFRYWQERQSVDAATRLAFGLTLDGFEKRFQERTRHTYGALSVLTDFSLLTLVLLLMLLPFYFARRTRNRRRLETMKAADAVAERAQSESVLVYFLGEPEVLVPDAPEPSDSPTAEGQGE